MVSISAVIVHADIGTPAHQLERIGARLNMMATEGAGRGVLIVPASLIDTAFGAAGHSDVQILCQPGPAEVITAVAIDRKSVVVGKSVSGRVTLGGRRIIKKKKKVQPIRRNDKT